MAVVWYYARGGERRGPMSWDELRAAARAGSFGAEDLVWTPGYGAEWRRASTLDALFPPPKPAEDAPPGPADREAAANAAATPPPSPAPPHAEGAPRARVRVFRDRSPFEPETPDHRAPDPRPSCLFSLRTALANTRVVLMRPFSLARWLAFSVAVLLMLLGAQSEWSLVPAASPTLRSAARSAGLGAVAESRLFTFAGRWKKQLSAANITPQLVEDLGESMRDASARAVAWARAARTRDLFAVFGGGAALLLVFCVMRTWFLARSWTLFVERVYRRDEPILLSWFDAREPSRAVFRGVLAWRLALLALNAAFLAGTVLALARVPEGAAGGNVVCAVALALGAPLLADVLAMGFLRDLAVPRVVLRRLRFGAAVRESLAALGAWYVRYLLMLGLLAAAVWSVLANLLALLFGPSFGNGSAPLPFLFAALATPWQLLRCL